MTDDIHNNVNDTENDLHEPLLPPSSSYSPTATQARSTVSSSGKRKACPYISKGLFSIFEIYTNQTGSFRNIASGLLIATCLGTIVGLIMPKNEDLPTYTYRICSSILGYTYFFCWSISFYPQLMINISRKSVSGLSTDASIMQVFNFASYAAYCTFFFFDKDIRQEYKDRHGGGAKTEIMVSSSDVAFSIHALLLTLIMIGQITYYGGYQATPISYVTLYITTSLLFLCSIYTTLILLHVPHFLWIDFLYLLAMIKLVLTITTYIPQLVLNCQRKSTVGFNIWNIILDFSGGFLSLLQLLLDGYNLGDVKDAIKGNWAKCILSLISLFFDSIFFLQHFVLYYKPYTRSISESLDGKNMDEEEEEDAERIRMV